MTKHLDNTPIDRFGNKIRKGTTMYWGKLDNPVRVIDVQNSNKVNSPDPEHPGGYVEVMIRFPFPFDPDGQFVVFKDFMTIVNPEEQKLVDEVVDRIAGGDNVQQIRR